MLGLATIVGRDFGIMYEFGDMMRHPSPKHIDGVV